MYSFDFDYKSKSRLAPKIGCHTLWDDDDNTQGPWDGSFENPYNIVQDAIDNAPDEPFLRIDVIIKPGEYPGFFVPQHLPGFFYFEAETRNEKYLTEGVVINGEGAGASTIILSGDYCKLAGLSIRGSCEDEICSGLEIHSDHNTIIGCDIFDNVNGVYVRGSASNNNFVENYIHNNDFGFFVDPNCNNNRIYHNKFYNNNYFNAKDLGNNNWYYGLIGNSWDDYEGEDNDGDGIGDEPHPIPGNFNFDNYPIKNESKYPFNTNPWINKFEGKTSGTKGEKYGYAVVFYDDQYHDGILEIDWDDGSATEYSDYMGAGQEYLFEHVWSNDGLYNIKVRAIDMLGLHSEWETLPVSIPKQKNKNPWNDIFQKLINIFPMLEQIIKIIY